ncbi:HAD-IB family hydrolase [Litorivicinus lipolyticus]|uniref:HAD-IB family hydrolase n=1 Tax=Litorivicinus lipolyticus TaxID=418701 RepID=A0A5Q2QA27_9GAMM|nr:HAD-IB family hydrolase [Litorivicinus lipolyticus]QGG79111.1 HAD-IB family hydrolase [Litorivicinus lipolyticus]
MKLAIFDLDHTLLHDDSDRGWNDFLVTLGVVDPEEHKANNARWYHEYANGTLNIRDYNRWAFRLHREFGTAQVTQWRDQYVSEVTPTMVAKQTPAVLDGHRKNGDEILVITATSLFIAGPIVKSLGIEHCLGLDNEVIDGEYTGEVIGIPTFQGGKVDALNAWLNDRPAYESTTFYSDSHNDLPLLQQVDHPVVVDGDERLLAHAKQHGWPSTSFRD